MTPMTPEQLQTNKNRTGEYQHEPDQGANLQQDGHPHEHDRDPSLRDLPITIMEPATPGIVGLDTRIPVDILEFCAGKYLPFLPELLPLWISGGL